MPRTADEISPLEFLQLVAEPHRWQMLRELTQSDRRVGELTEIVGGPQNLVSYHLAELRKAAVTQTGRPEAAIDNIARFVCDFYTHHDYHTFLAQAA